MLKISRRLTKLLIIAFFLGLLAFQLQILVLIFEVSKPADSAPDAFTFIFIVLWGLVFTVLAEIVLVAAWLIIPYIDGSRALAPKTFRLIWVIIFATAFALLAVIIAHIMLVFYGYTTFSEIITVTLAALLCTTIISALLMVVARLKKEQLKANTK